ncbi:hypothetical protein [Actinoallomurus sp. NPDC050550]|uniref:hypothetical protein n=1 Tax=Actinoallomurus sp. NPDC050550 TaxID=3154937 RepID=UPI0033DB10E9
MTETLPSTAVPERVRLWTVASLIAGRSAYRVALYAAGILLLAAWGSARFAPYAAALGTTSWLTTVVQMGPEKAALKLLPRARRTHGDLVAALRAFALLAPILLVGAAAVAVVAAPQSRVALYALAAAQATALGSVLLGVALHRALGRPRSDTLTFLLLALGTVVLIGLAYAPGIPPVAYLTGQLVLTLAALGLLLRRPAPKRRPRPGVRRLLTATSVLMGTPEVLMNAGTSVLYVELTAGTHAGQSSELYLVLQGWAVIIAFVYFLQRLLQPRLSARLAIDGAADGRARIARLARPVVALGAGWLVAATALLAAFPTSVTDLPPIRLTVLLAVLIVTRIPAYLLMSQVTFVLENTDAAGLRTSARGAVFSMLTVAGVGAVATPLLGAAGAVYALGVKELVLALNVAYRPRPKRLTRRPHK